MLKIKRYFKQNSHNKFFKILAGFGRALNRLYENRNHDPYSNGELMVLKKIYKLKPAVIIDGGTNVGDYSLSINSIIPGCKIYSFEPVKSTFQKLKHNTKEFDNIIPINKGLYKENCKKEIYIFNSDTHSSLYNIQGLSYTPNERAEIELICGDDFIKEYKIDKVDFLKLDIEGAEFDALQGFQNCIKNNKIRIIQFEYGYINITTKKLLIDFYNFFKANGYVIGKVFPKYVEFRNYEFKYEDFLGPSYIAINKSDTDLIKLLSRK